MVLASPLADSRQPLLVREVKHLTILFGDLVGSTEMVSGRLPDEAQAILAPALEIMVEAVQAFNGTLNHVLGDGVMALFGAPLSQEDHALRACCAAFRMHEAAASSHSAIRLRIGLASGPTLLGGPGNEAAGTYPAFGATIHLASRLQTLARPGTTLCDASTLALAGPTVQSIPLGPHALRGFDVPRDLFALTGINQGGLRFSGSVARGLSPHVGRDRELAALSAYAQSARSGVPVAVAIVGDAGAGKSRLAWEFARSQQPDEWQVIQAEAVSYGRDVPYQLIAALLRSAFEVDLRVDPDLAAERVRGRLSHLGDAAAYAPALLSLMALPLGEDAAAWDMLDSLVRREALDGSVGAALNALARHRPITVLIEDLQWADAESLRLLDFIPAADCRLLLLTTHRPDYTPAWGRRRLNVVALGPLSSDDMDRLAQIAFPGTADEELRRLLIRRAAGNPFFLEELFRDAQSTRLRQDGGHDDGQPAMPPTIQAVIAARIDRLAAEGKRALVTAAVLGNRFSLRILRDMLSRYSERDFRSSLTALQGAGMFGQARQSSDDIGFSHALIQEVAYNGLPREQRRRLHQQVVQTIRRTDTHRLAEQAETLVYHAARGEMWEELIDAARVAGRRAASRSAYAEASRFFNQAVEACGRLPHSSEALASEIDLRFELRNSLFPTAGIAQSLDNSMRAESLARQLGNRHRLGWATAFLAKDLQLVGRPNGALEMAAAAIRLSDGDQDLDTAARYFSAQAAYSAGDYAMAVATLRALISTLEARDPMTWTGTPGPSIIFYHGWLTWALSRLGETAEAEAAATRMRRLADEADLPLCRTIAHLSEGFALAFAGRLREAEATLRFSLLLCRKWEFFAWATNISSCLGHVLSRLGQFDEAIDLIEQAADRTRRSGILVSHANELAWLAEAHQLAGRADEAARQAEKAIEVARMHGERGNEALANVVLGEALADLGSASASQAHYEAALRLAAATGMAPLLQRCRSNLAALGCLASG